MAGYVFALVATLILPLAAAGMLARRLKTARPVLLGAATFFVFQMLLRIPLLQWVLPQSVHYVLFQATQPMVHLLLLSGTAGIFEEVGRYLVMRRFMKDAPAAHAVGFGVGHGGIEAVLLVGLQLAFLGVASPSMIPGMGASFFAAGVERIFAMGFHICLSVMVWRSLRDRRPLFLLLAILLHTLLNAMALYLVLLQVSVLVIEGAIALFTLMLLFFTLRFLRRIEKQGGTHHVAKNQE